MPKAKTAVVFLPLAILVILVSVQLRQAEACRGGGGWRSYGRKCYKLVTNVKKSWPDAKVYCRHLGGYLAVPTTAWEENFVRRLTMSHRMSSWIGVFRAPHSGCWLSALTHRPIRYSAWGHGEPNNYRHRENCVEVFVPKSYTWNDRQCSTRRPFICEKRKRGRRC